jgi:3-phenylpropionate/cinnamic acid dioxygenase small subunit
MTNELTRIRELEDRQEIRQIFVDYAKFLDSGDHAGYASLFASKGVFKALLGQAIGPAEIEAVLDKNLGPQVRGHLPKAIHIMNNQQIDLNGDVATTDVVWFYLTTDADGVPTVLQSGHYRDELVRQDGKWKIQMHDISRIMGRSPMDPPTPTRLDALENRLQVLEDKDAIWQLFMVYKKHLDARDFKAYASLFTPDAFWGGNLGRAIGPAEIEALLIKTLEVYPSDLERTHHLVMNPIITVSGDSAKAKSNWGFMTRSDSDEPVFKMLGRYSDDLVRTPEGWKFSRRVAYSDIPYISLTGII